MCVCVHVCVCVRARVYVCVRSPARLSLSISVSLSFARSLALFLTLSLCLCLSLSLSVAVSVSVSACLSLSLSLSLTQRLMALLTQALERASKQLHGDEVQALFQQVAACRDARWLATSGHRAQRARLVEIRDASRRLDGGKGFLGHRSSSRPRSLLGAFACQRQLKLKGEDVVVEATAAMATARREILDHRQHQQLGPVHCAPHIPSVQKPKGKAGRADLVIKDANLDDRRHAIVDAVLAHTSSAATISRT